MIPLYGRDVLIIGSAINNANFFISVIRLVCLSNLQQIRYNWRAATSLLIIKSVGGQLVAKKPYLIKTLRLTLLLQQPTVTKC